MRVLFEADVPVHYRFVFLSSVDVWPDLTETRRGQQNGLCGAAVPGVLSMTTGLHTGRVPLVVQWHDTEPELGLQWEDVVEVPFAPQKHELDLSSFEYRVQIRLPEVGSMRARFCAAAMDEAFDLPSVTEDEPTVDSYLLALWPAEPAPDAVLRQTSAAAGYWHRVARSGS